MTQICQSTWGATDASPLGIGLSRRRDGLMASSSRPGMPSFLRNSRLSSAACSAFPPSEDNKLNKMQFTACPQVSSERGEVGGETQGQHQWVQISMPLLAYTSCRAGPKVFLFTLSWGSYCRNAGLARCASSSIPSPPRLTGYQLPLPALEAARLVQSGSCFGILGNGCST